MGAGRRFWRPRKDPFPPPAHTLMTKFLNRSVRAFTVILCLARPAGFAEAQASNDVRTTMTVPDSAHIQIVTLRDGSTIFGRILAVNADTVTFQTQAGNIQLSASAIREIKEIPAADLREGEYWFPNPNSTRLFFAPSGQMLKQVWGYFSG